MEGIKGSMLRNLTIKKFEVTFVKLGFWGKKKAKGEFTVAMRPLENALEMTEEIKLPDKASKTRIILDISIEVKVRKGLKNPIMDKVLRKKLVIDKIIPPFDASTVVRPGAPASVPKGAPAVISSDYLFSKLQVRLLIQERKRNSQRGLRSRTGRCRPKSSHKN